MKALIHAEPRLRGRDLGRRLCLELVVSETLVECFVDFEPAVEEREHAAGLLAAPPAACVGVGKARGASCGVEARPALRPREEALPEVAARRFSSPHGDELERQTVVELLG
jgi:hypothetical protein